ncbi:hypothetical protein HZS_1074 [Henneguya salminicola]|nr:hypothetical protein HZS_1074 [Henneguya salminicola]
MKFVIYVIFQILLKISLENCVMRGRINDSETKYYNGTALPLSNESVPIFIKLCSSLLPNDYKTGQPVFTCCAEDQLQFFETQLISLNNLNPYCDICRENIQRLTCNIICSTAQSDFSLAHIKFNTTDVVEGLELALSSEFAQGLFDSCKDVVIPSSNLPIVSFLCGDSGGKCTPEKLIKGMLSYSEFKLTPYILPSNSTAPINISNTANPIAARCNESYQAHNVSLRACSCINCEITCAIPYTIDKIHLIFNKFTVFQLVVLCFYIPFVIIYMAVFIIIYLRYRSRHVLYETNNEDEEIADININQVYNEEEPLLGFSSTTYRFQQKVQYCMQNLLRRWGIFVASNKICFSLFSLIVLIFLSSGIAYHFEVTSNPIDIWSPPNSEFRKQKEYFDENFGPFYRVEQIIMKATNVKNTNHVVDGNNVTFGSTLQSDIIEQVFKLQQDIHQLKATYVSNNIIHNVSLADICFKPLEPQNTHCAMFSITQYFQNNLTLFKEMFNGSDWHNHIYNCVGVPETMVDSSFGNASCFSDFFAPVNPKLVLGNYTDDPIEATVLVINFLVNNYIKNTENSISIAWERSLLAYLKDFKHPNITLSYSAECSVQDEIDRQSHAEARTVSISYLVMFIYVCFSLGTFSFKNFSTFFVKQKIMLGFVGVILVFLSVLSSIGLFCYLKYKVNMIILEVLPFLTLAIGVDNIFLIVHELRRLKRSLENDIIIPNLIGEVMANVGQGMVVSAVAQITTFSIGAISNIPAVKSFTLFAAAAIAINFFMQMTLFLVILTLDCMREQSKRPDILCCITCPNAVEEDHPGVLEHLFNLISKITLSCYARPIILFSFITVWFVSLYHVPSLKIGLDQTTALPINSYLQVYFKDIFKYLKSGPPVYFMVYPGYRYEQKKYQDLISSCPGCDPDSLTTTIFRYSKISNYSKIATASYSWLDAYAAWLRPDETNLCCRYKIDPTTNKSVFCPSYLTKNDKDCKPCIKPNDEPVNVTEEEFSLFLPWFLLDLPGEICPHGGKPNYGKSVVLNNEYYVKKDKNAPSVLTSAFMAYHTSLASSDDLISALTQAVNISKTISKTLNHTVMPYSVYYIYYESYFTIWKEAAISFGVSLVAILSVNLFLYGFEVRMAIIMTSLIYLMNLVNAGFMYARGIHLNPVSLVNLILFIGINVEFLSHIGRAYLSAPSPSRTQKAKFALAQTGASVFSGIAMTKILGVLILSFSSSILFRVYYFEMYAIAILVGSLHGLILLPVVLSYFGPTIANTSRNPESLLDEED